jgi:UDP-N-acetylglucosamine--N-acetylmuramyl-(pentapeptide) pyrophosphoryl-undecaprenol N-acetylglucosamine transferase
MVKPRLHFMGRNGMGKKLKIAIACGGTGGHIFPGLATGRELLEHGHDVTLWLAGKDIESDAVKDWDGKIITIPAEGFQFGVSMRSVLTLLKLFKAFRLALPLMRENNPDVVLAMGSYASFAPIKAARKCKIPYVLHEANLLPGRAVSFLARHAHTVAVSFEKSRFYLKHPNLETTGMPLRKDLQLASMKPRRERGVNDPLRILVMGGSRGAQILNEILPKAVVAAAGKGVKIEVEHIAGVQDSEELEEVYRQGGVQATIHHFVQHMEEIYLNVDFAICRSGAASCAELAVFGIPALLVPYPYAVRDHQMGNARALQDSGAADVVAQEDLTATWLRDYLMNISEKPERIDRMVAAMKKRAQINASGRLAELLEKVGGA